MDVLVPFDARTPKTRLSPSLDAAERHDFAVAMLRDVLATVRAGGHDPSVLATETVDCDAPVAVADRPLTPTVNDALDARSRPVAVVMADLPLVSADALERLFAPEAPVVLAPGVGGGTNALVVRTDDFHVDFHGVSVRDHRRIAGRSGISVDMVDSYRLAMDVDEPSDLAEVLLHGDGHAASWLREAGFQVDATEGRVRVHRIEDSTPEQG